MSGIRTGAAQRGLGYTRIASKWGWFVALGVILIAAGFFALGDVVAFTLVSALFIGAMMLVGGLFQIVHAFMTKAWQAFALNLILGVLYVIAGFLIMDEPVQGSLIITMFLSPPCSSAASSALSSRCSTGKWPAGGSCCWADCSASSSLRCSTRHSPGRGCGCSGL